MKRLYYVIQTLLRGSGSNITKVISLGLGLTMSIMLFSPVSYQQSFNTCYRDYDNLYEVFSTFTIEGEERKMEGALGPVASAILEDFPDQIEAATCVFPGAAYMPIYNGNVRFDDFKTLGDSLFFRTMGIDVLSGDPVHDLSQKDVIYLSDRFAKKIFGEENPIGKILKYGEELDLIVKGTYAALPENATMKPEAVMSMATAWYYGWVPYSWNAGMIYGEYIRFRPGVDKKQVISRLDAMIEKHAPADVQKMTGYAVSVKPIKDTYQDKEEVKLMTTTMTVLGLAILFIVSLNYVLVSMSSLSSRAKMVGVHKCSGAGSGNIFGMFMLETGIIILAGIVLMALVLFKFSDLIEDAIAIKPSMLFVPGSLWMPLAVVLFLFLVGGVLPGRAFARIPVTQVFLRYTEGRIRWKRPLLFVQFAGVAFVSGLMCVMVSQYTYVRNKDMGYNPKDIVVSSTVYMSDNSHRDAVCQFFRDLPYVQEVSLATNTPMLYNGAIVRTNEGLGDGLFQTYWGQCMTNYPEMMAMSLKEGHIGDVQKGEVLVNELFADWMRWGDNIIGRTFFYDGVKATVTGVLNDFHIGSFHQEQRPFVAICNDYFYDGKIHIRLKEPFAENLQKLNKASGEAFPRLATDFVSMEQIVADAYKAERIFCNATMLATIMMLFIMLVGLAGYTADEVNRRSKEIAIRKVNGAEASGILWLISREVAYVAVPAIVIGLIASWYVNSYWMDRFADKISIGWGIYLLLAVVNLAIIVSCVLWKSWRIANENPVNRIKNE